MRDKRIQGEGSLLTSQSSWISESQTNEPSCLKNWGSEQLRKTQNIDPWPPHMWAHTWTITYVHIHIPTWMCLYTTHEKKNNVHVTHTLMLWNIEENENSHVLLSFRLCCILFLFLNRARAEWWLRRGHGSNSVGNACDFAQGRHTEGVDYRDFTGMSAK